MPEVPPPQFAQYPRQPNAPRIRFEAIGEAWKLFQEDMGVWIVATLLYLILTIAFIAPFYAFALAGIIGNTRPQFEDIMRMYAIMIPGIFIGYIGQSIGQAGLFNLAMRKIQGYEISLRDFFSTGGSVFSHIGAGLAFMLGVMVGSMACYLPGFIVGGLLMFIHPIIVHQRLGGIAALKQSWEILTPHIWTAMGFYLVISLIAGIGGILCGVGLLFSFPLYPLAISIVYRDFVQALHSGYDPAQPVAPCNVADR